MGLSCNRHTKVIDSGGVKGVLVNNHNLLNEIMLEGNIALKSLATMAHAACEALSLFLITCLRCYCRNTRQNTK